MKHPIPTFYYLIPIMASLVLRRLPTKLLIRRCITTISKPTEQTSNTELMDIIKHQRKQIDGQIQQNRKRLFEVIKRQQRVIHDMETFGKEHKYWDSHSKYYALAATGIAVFGAYTI